MKRVKKEVKGWEVSDPKLVAVCWSSDGQLYALDGSANLYSVSFDSKKYFLICAYICLIRLFFVFS